MIDAPARTAEAAQEQPAAPLRDMRVTLETLTQTGPCTLAGRYLRRFWQPVLMSDELQPGRAMPVDVLGQSITVYRGEGGTAYAVGFRCAHRGAQLSVGTVEGEHIRCLYHGWMFNAGGKCVERPSERDAGREDATKVGSYPVFEYLGLVFVYLGEGEPPARLNFPEFEQAGVRETYGYERACNYFQNIENGVDEAHLPFTHRQSLFDVLNTSVPEISARESAYGVVQTGKRADGQVFEAHFMMPNMLSFSYPASSDPAVKGWALYLSWRVPLDDRRHKTFIVEHFKVDPSDAAAFEQRRLDLRRKTESLPPRQEVSRAILAGRAQLKDFADRPDYVLLGDDVAQCAQGAIQDRSQERLGRSDVAVVMVRRTWMRELEALRDGAPMRAWQYPLQVPRLARS